MRLGREGFSMVELIVVMLILGIISTVLIPRMIIYKKITEERICQANRKTVAQFYKSYLASYKHSELLFNQFMIENIRSVCPCNGTISYEDDIVRCSIHNNFIDNEDQSIKPTEEVPWLKTRYCKIVSYYQLNQNKYAYVAYSG